MIERSGTLSPREHEEMQYNKEMTEIGYAHGVRIKELDIEAAKLEAKIQSWFKIPLTILRLPLFVLFVIPLTVYAIKGKDVPPEYWALLR